LVREEKGEYSSSSSFDGERSDEVPVDMDVNMVFVLPNDFTVTKGDVAELASGVEHAVFEKSKE
jgi:hypothetical protein